LKFETLNPFNPLHSTRDLTTYPHNPTNQGSDNLKLPLLTNFFIRKQNKI
jgi:hypothetical protein